MSKCRLLVTGSRSITDARVVAYVLVQVLHDLGGQVQEVIHGGAIGVDRLAGAWAAKQGWRVRVVPPKLDGGAHRYIERDLAMVDMATHVVAIWDGTSSGTRITMEYARRQGKLHSLWLGQHVAEELDGLT